MFYPCLLRVIKTFKIMGLLKIYRRTISHLTFLSTGHWAIHHLGIGFWGRSDNEGLRGVPRYHTRCPRTVSHRNHSYLLWLQSNKACCLKGMGKGMCAKYTRLYISRLPMTENWVVLCTVFLVALRTKPETSAGSFYLNSSVSLGAFSGQ